MAWLACPAVFGLIARESSSILISILKDQRFLNERPRSSLPAHNFRKLSRTFIAIGVIAGAKANIVLAAPAAVSIEGGPETASNAYRWTITNNHGSPIVRVELPQYRGSLFFPPTGWTSSCTNLVAVGAPDAPGTCTAIAKSESQGIALGRSSSFGLQLASGSVKRGFGEVVIGFADSSTHRVGGVMVPVPETLGDRYIPLIGLGTILALYVGVQITRSRKKSRLKADA